MKTKQKNNITIVNSKGHRIWHGTRQEYHEQNIEGILSKSDRLLWVY